MATMVGREHNVVVLLKHLVSLDYDAIEAYRAAVQRIKDDRDRGQLSQFMADHERHIAELGAALEAMGQRVPRGPDMKQVLTKGKVVLGSVFGDRAILIAMRTNEKDTNRAYERAAARTDTPQSAKEAIARGLADERRHRVWIEDRLAERPAAAASHR